ncbi:hypothetical protein BH10BAC4_BH10BAC4_15770 [soil metagenome]
MASLLELSDLMRCAVNKGFSNRFQRLRNKRKSHKKPNLRSALCGSVMSFETLLISRDLEPLPITVYRLPLTDYLFPTTDYRLPI